MGEFIKEVFDFVGSGGLVIGSTWLLKELISNFIKDKFMFKQANLEHEYFRKRLQYESKYEIYKAIYIELKKLQGSFFTFDAKNFDYNFTGSQEEALEFYKKYSNDSKEEQEKFIQKYKGDNKSRFIFNYSLSVDTVKNSRKDFVNIISENEFIFSKEEKLNLSSIMTQSQNLVRFIEGAQSYTQKKITPQNYDDFKSYFGKRYKTLCIRFDKLIENYTETIKEELFM